MTIEVPETDRVRLPFAVRGLPQSAALVRVVCEVVEREEWPAKARAFAVGERSFAAPMLMRLLTYCYANGLYDSDSIALSLVPSNVPDYFDARKLPDAKTISRFRRLNRSGLEQCLAGVLESVAHVECCEWRRCGEREPARVLYRCEARERIDQAMRLDMIQNDI